MQLQEFFDYKNRLMRDLLTNEAIVKLINEAVPLESAKDLIYTQVFPYEFAPETIEEGKVYIFCDVDILAQSVDKTYYSPIIYIWVMAHESLLRLPEGGVRTDKLCHEICKAINGSRFYGLGELNLYSCKRFAPLTKYQGKCLTFHARDFNKLHTIPRPVPVNRRAEQ